MNFSGLTYDTDIPYDYAIFSSTYNKMKSSIEAVGFGLVSVMFVHCCGVLDKC
jgi:hypothetical protein